MKNNCIVAPRLYNTGFIPESASVLRIKQGLVPYILGLISILNNTCNIYNMYPEKQTQLRYNCVQNKNACDYFDALLHGKTHP